MKSSKPFSFVIWTDDNRLPKYLLEIFSSMSNFDYFHYIHHEAEQEAPSVITKATKSPPKAHYHAVLHFRKATDYDLAITGRVGLWAKDHPEYGPMPFTFNRTHEGKVNNLSTWLAYVVHDPQYMQYIESKCDKPESHKRQYDWNDIVSSDYDLLNAQVINALSFIEKCVKSSRMFEDAKDMAMEGSRLLDILANCESYAQMLVAQKIYQAKYYEKFND